MPPPRKSRCVCKTHGCTSKPGGHWFVTKAVLRIHEADDEELAMLDSLIEDQAEERARITKEQDELKAIQEAREVEQRKEKQKERERLAFRKAEEQVLVDDALEGVQERDQHVIDLLAQLSITEPPVAEDDRQPRYRIEHERLQVDSLAKILDLQAELSNDIKGMGTPSTIFGLAELRAGVRMLDALLVRAHRIRGDIHVTRSNSRFVSVQTLSNEAWMNAKIQIKSINSAQGVWRDAAEQKERSFNASNAATYSTGKKLKYSCTLHF
jgi:hypothetical protein